MLSSIGVLISFGCIGSFFESIAVDSDNVVDAVGVDNIEFELNIDVNDAIDVNVVIDVDVDVDVDINVCWDVDVVVYSHL